MTKPQDGQIALAPHLVCNGAAAAIDFYRRAFGATEMMRIAGPDGKIMHAAVSINGAMVMLADENRDYGMLGPKALNGTPVTINLGVADTDGAVKQASGAGANVIMPAEDMFWGDRYAVVEDPYGHRWAFAQRKKTMTEAEIREAAKAAMCAQET